MNFGNCSNMLVGSIRSKPPVCLYSKGFLKLLLVVLSDTHLTRTYSAFVSLGTELLCSILSFYTHITCVIYITCKLSRKQTNQCHSHEDSCNYKSPRVLLGKAPKHNPSLSPTPYPSSGVNMFPISGFGSVALLVTNSIY